MREVLRPRWWSSGLLIAWLCCTPLGVWAAPPLRLAGVGAALGSLHLLAAAFQARHPQMRVEVLSSLGSRGGMQATADGVVDLDVTGREPAADERRLNLHVLPYARSPIVFVVAAGSEQSGLRHQQLADYWLGIRHRWPDGKRVRPVLQPGSTCETSALIRSGATLGRALTEALMRAGMPLALTAQQAASLMERLPGAFGYLTLSQLQAERRHLIPLSYDGVSPTLDNLRAGRYPFSVTLYTVTRYAPSVAAKRFLAFIHTPEGARILRHSGNLVLGGRG